MAQVSYGTITITDTNDIEEIFSLYGGSNDANTSPTYSYAAVTGGTTWKRNVTAITNYKYIWQITAITKTGITVDSSNWQQFYGAPIRITGEEGDDARNITAVTPYYYLSSSDSGQTDGGWSTSPQAYPSTGVYYYWTKTITTYDSGSPSESTPVLDMFLTNAAKDARDANAIAALANSIAQHANEDAQGAMSQASAANIIAEGLQTRLKYMWMNEVNSTSYPAGSYMASGNNRTFSYSDSSTYGFNSFLEHTKLHFRYNAIDLTTIGLDGLKLYSPILNSGNTEIVNSKMGINITSEQIHIGGNGEDEEGYIIVDTDGMKIYSKYTPIIHGGTSVYGFDMVAQIGANTRIGALESGHMLLQSSGLWLKEKNNIIGRILNSSVHDLIPNYTEIFKFQWDINTTLQTSFESTFGVNYGTLSFLCGIQSEDDIIWGSSSSVTIDGTTYSFMLENSTSDSFSPSTCTITSSQQNTTRSVTVVVQLTYTAATSGPYTSFGQNANVQGTGGFAAGIGVSSLGLGQVVLGQYNQEDFHAKFIIGNGTDDNNRSNLLVVDGDGNLLIQDGFKIVNTTGNCIQLTSDGMEIFKAAISVAKFGTTARIGRTNEAHIVQTSTGLNFVDSAGIIQASMTANNGTFVLEDVVSAHKIELGSGLTIENNQEETLASFSGSGSQIGLDSEGHVVTTSNGITMHVGSEELLNIFSEEISQGHSFSIIEKEIDAVNRIFISFDTTNTAKYASFLAVHAGSAAGIELIASAGGRKEINMSGNVEAAGYVRDTIISATPTISRSTGASVSNVEFKRSGNVAQLRFVLTYSTSVAAGANLFTGTLASAYRPSMHSAGCGYYGSSSIIGLLNTDGSITVRNASTGAVTISSGAAISFTYIID